MTLMAGVDSSTQSCKVAICGAESGRVVRQASASHPDATEVDPQRWWDAWATASTGLLDDVRAIGVGGQQHGMVALDTAVEVVRPALLRNDSRSATDAADLVAERGVDAWAFCRPIRVPRALAPDEPAGHTDDGMLVAAATLSGAPAPRRWPPPAAFTHKP